jgi:hypothetical protein
MAARAVRRGTPPLLSSDPKVVRRACTLSGRPRSSRLETPAAFRSRSKMRTSPADTSKTGGSAGRREGTGSPRRRASAQSAASLPSSQARSATKSGRSGTASPSWFFSSAAFGDFSGWLRRQLGVILRDLCRQTGIDPVEGQAMPDHIRRCPSLPLESSVAHAIGFLKGKSAVRSHRE